jgi:hypothetical protein
MDAEINICFVPCGTFASLWCLQRPVPWAIDITPPHLARCRHAQRHAPHTQGIWRCARTVPTC